jgi:hypothetical protein
MWEMAVQVRAEKNDAAIEGFALPGCAQAAGRIIISKICDR